MAAIADTLPDTWAAKGHRGLSEPGSAGKKSNAAPIAAGVAAAGVGIALFASWKGRQDKAADLPKRRSAINEGGRSN